MINLRSLGHGSPNERARRVMVQSANYYRAVSAGVPHDALEVDSMIKELTDLATQIRNACPSSTRDGEGSPWRACILPIGHTEPHDYGPAPEAPKTPEGAES